MKALMAVTGLILVVFLLVHMYGNLKMFLGAESYDHYAEWLKGDILYPLIPKGWFIWLFRAFMVAAIALHIYSAATLWRRAVAANPTAYEAKKKLAQTYAARTMRWGGVILVLLLVFHLLQFTTKSTLIQTAATLSPYDTVVSEFQSWWLVLVYALWILTVCMHVRHGFWSAFATLGANTSAKARVVLNGCAWAVALVLYIGFMIMPVAVLFGWIH